MANPGDFAYTVKQQADIVRIVGDYVKLKKTGAQNFGGLCPFHQEKTPSFSVHATKQFYHCFGCGVSGDVFSFVQKIENVSFPEAVRAVAQKLGIALPKQQFSGPGEAKEAALRGALIEMHEKACVFFEETLRQPEGAKAREYLSARGLKDADILAFRLGFAPDSGFLLRDRLRGQYNEEQLKASGLFSWKDVAADDRRPNAAGQPTTDQRPTTLYSKFRSRITFPISNEMGRIIAFTGRALASDEKAGPKYLNSPETPIYSKSRVLYNLDRAKEAIKKLDYAIIVEGQMDCIAVFTAGLHNVIASSGTAFTETQVRLLGRYTRNIVVNFDPDAAGARAAERSLALLVAEDFQIKVLTLEGGLDPDNFIRKRGVDAYKQALMAAPRYFDYLIERARAQFPVKTAQGKQQAVNFLLQHLQHVPSRIVRDELAADIAQKLGIDSSVLRQEIRHVAATRGTTVKAIAQAQVTPAERILIRVLAVTADQLEPLPGLRHQAQYTVSQEQLHLGLPTEALLGALVAADPETLDPLALELSESDRHLLAEVLMRDDEPLSDELIHGALEALRRRHLERRQQQVRARIADAERKNDAAALAQLLQEKQRIDKDLSAL
ncbi:MAG TPA: DNA primase [Terriglobales bacterium]|nr:DNA primase [Terriglobales bacterium]